MRRNLNVLFTLALITCAAVAYADPPARIGRLNYVSGTVSIASAEAPDQWIQAVLNRPLTSGDRLWADNDSRAELHVGPTAVRMGPQTSFDVLNLDDRTMQLRLGQGSINLRARRQSLSRRGARLTSGKPRLSHDQLIRCCQRVVLDLIAHVVLRPQSQRDLLLFAVTKHGEDHALTGLASDKMARGTRELQFSDRSAIGGQEDVPLAEPGLAGGKGVNHDPEQAPLRCLRSLRPELAQHLLAPFHAEARVVKDRVVRRHLHADYVAAEEISIVAPGDCTPRPHQVGRREPFPFLIELCVQLTHDVV